MVRSLVRRRLWTTWVVALLLVSGVPSICGCPAMTTPAPEACHPTPSCCDPASTPSLTAPSECCDWAPADTMTTLSTDSAMARNEGGQHAVALLASHSQERVSHPVPAVQLRVPRQVVLRI